MMNLIFALIFWFPIFVSAQVVGGGPSVVMPTTNPKPPTVQRFTSGTGTYTKSAGARWIRVRLCGGGGGGGSGNTSNQIGGDGVATTFGTSLLTAGGAVKPSNAFSKGSGGSVTVNAPAVTVVALSGADGQDGGTNGLGGVGGASPFGGAGGGGYQGANGGSSARANSCSGGGGGGGATPNNGSGGGAGGYIEAIITNPSATYSYTVGAGGTGGAQTGTGAAGGNGGSGVIIVEEYY